MTGKTYDKIDSVTLLVGDGEWSALYVNGDLDTYGDHYLADERLQTLFGVHVTHTNDWYRGDGGRNYKVAQSLPEYRAWQLEDKERQDRADALRAEAKRLEEAADQMEKKGWNA